MTTLRQRAEAVLAGGPGTFSKHWKRYAQGVGPFALVSGEGCYVTGDNGKVYLDTIAALGPILLGYGHPQVTEAVVREVHHGTSFSMVHPLEIEVGEKLCELLPCVEQVRLCRNGTDATNMAVRLMRAITGKQHIIFVGYAGGGADSYGSTTDKRAGILSHIMPYNHQVVCGDIGQYAQALSQASDDLAGVMVEVPPQPWGEPTTEMTRLVEIYQGYAQANKGLFTLDEVVTYPRYDIHGAQHVYGIMPDLCTVSKAIANGLPLAALGGKRAYMQRLTKGDIFASYTFSGETTALAACKATLEVLETTEALANLHNMGRQYGNGLTDLFAAYDMPAELWGTPARLSVRWQDVPGVATKAELRTLWMAEHARHGVLVGIGVALPMTCWSQAEVDLLLDVANEACVTIRKALQQGNVRGDLPCPVIEDVLAVR